MRSLLVLGWVIVGLLALSGIYVGFLGGVWGLIPGLPAILLFALLAMLTLRRGAEAGWFLPFAWILVVPAVTVPSHIGLLGVITDGYDYEGVFASGPAGECTQVNQREYDKLWHCPLGASTATLAPGLLNLAAFVGLLHPSRRLRRAALAAGAFGAARLLVPAIIYAADAPGVEIIGSWQWPPAMGSLASGYASVALWSASLAAAFAFPWLVKAGQGEANTRRSAS